MLFIELNVAGLFCHGPACLAFLCSPPFIVRDIIIKEGEQ